MTDFLSLIQRTKEQFGSAPRSFSIWNRLHNKMTPPKWMKVHQDVRLLSIYEDQKALFTNGLVVWGHLVQANSLLFSPGLSDHPASIIFSLDSHFDKNLYDLETIAHNLYGHKGQEVNEPELAYFVDVITDEFKTPFNIQLPYSLTANRDVYFTSIMVCRKHLPKRQLISGWFPLLTNPRLTKASIILPFRYWNSQLAALWQEDIQ
jgi:hypothetical protein